ncbi:MFS transporter small subunit [Actinosynnema sp. ALI-1.44]|nr:hypothetical protein [Actinosynnema sp. ALI-1.44]
MTGPTPETDQAPADRRPLITIAWLWVGLPFAYGVYELVLKVTQLFKG